MSSPRAAIRDSRIVDIVGAPNVISDPQALAAYSVDGLAPQIVARPASAQEVSELVRLAAAENLAVIPTGARTKLGIGMLPARYDLAIDMKRLDRIISYDPGDLTLSVEAGIPLVRLAEVLAEHNQFLPLAVPFFDRTTVGGTLASGVDSPLRQAYGTARDFVLGMEFVSGDGALTKSGGRVVKNVSGYDLHKLFLGAIGSLGVITRINFKTFPRPSSERMFVASFASPDDALLLRQRIVASPISPSTLELLNPEMATTLLPELSNSTDWLLLAGISGSDKALNRSANELIQMAGQSGARKPGLLSGAERETSWTCLREAIPLMLQSSPAAIIFKITAIPSDLSGVLRSLASISGLHRVRAAAVIRGTGIAYWSILGDSGNVSTENAAAQEILQSGEGRHFHATILACPLELKRQLSVWGSPREDFLLMQRVKRAFDPHNIFAPGRFVGGL